jgi:hypothetical protein
MPQPALLDAQAAAAAPRAAQHLPGTTAAQVTHHTTLYLLQTQATQVCQLPGQLGHLMRMLLQ